MLVTSLGDIIHLVGRKDEYGVHLLGTSFFVNKTGLLVTAAHVVGNTDKDLLILLNDFNKENGYQDETDDNCVGYKATIKEIDPIHDICILKTDIKAESNFNITSSDGLIVGQNLTFWGYPHCNHGRKILTYNVASLGAKVMINTHGLKTKSIILNTQSQIGLSGSPVFNSANEIAAMIIGSYIPNNYELGSVRVGGIDPQTLTQTTRAISAEYIGDML